MRNLVIGISLSILLFNCTNTPPDPVNVSSITSNYQILADQRLTDNGPVYQIKIQTIDPTDCLNDQVDADLENGTDKISLFIDGINKGTPCEMGESNAAISLDLEEKLGEIPFEVDVQSLGVITGTINFEESAFFISTLSDNSVEIEQDHIFKVPEGMGWGYIDGNSSAGLDITSITQFFNLSPTANPDFNLIGTYYGFFSVNTSGNIEITDAPSGSEIFEFDARGDAFWDDIELQLDELKQKHPDVEYGFYRWNGQTLTN